MMPNDFTENSATEARNDLRDLIEEWGEVNWEFVLYPDKLAQDATELIWTQLLGRRLEE